MFFVNCVPTLEIPYICENFICTDDEDGYDDYFDHISLHSTTLLACIDGGLEMVEGSSMTWIRIITRFQSIHHRTLTLYVLFLLDISKIRFGFGNMAFLSSSFVIVLRQTSKRWNWKTV